MRAGCSALEDRLQEGRAELAAWLCAACWAGATVPAAGAAEPRRALPSSAGSSSMTCSASPAAQLAGTGVLWWAGHKQAQALVRASASAAPANPARDCRAQCALVGQGVSARPQWSTRVYPGGGGGAAPTARTGLGRQAVSCCMEWGAPACVSCSWTAQGRLLCMLSEWVSSTRVPAGPCVVRLTSCASASALPPGGWGSDDAGRARLGSWPPASTACQRTQLSR